MRVLLVALAIASGSGPHARAAAAWRRGSYMAQYASDRPWESRGLTPVAMTPQPEVDDVVLVAGRRPGLPIVVPPRGAPDSGYYRQVAAFLKQYLDAATGASFETTERVADEGRGIFVGPCAHDGLAPFLERARALDPEHFLISVFADGLVLAGRDIGKPDKTARVRIDKNHRRHSRGTFFAACEFLERFVGVRFYLPGELGTHIPYLAGRTVAIPAVSYTDGPVFEMRLASTGNYLTKDHQLLGYTRPEGVQWMIALRNADYYGWKSGHTDNYWHTFYAEEHPDWFALRPDGSRMVGQRGEHSAQRCYTNEAAFLEHLRAIEQYYKTGEGARKFAGCPPNEKYIYWWPNDGFRGCVCESCMQLTDPDGPPQARLSRLIWGYTAKLAAAVAERWPGRTLIGSFYSGWSAGSGDIELPGNVSFMILQTWTAYLKEDVYWDQVTGALAAKMSLVDTPVALWEHYPHRPRIANRMDAPYLLPHYLQKYVRYLRGKTSGVYLNGHQTSSFALDGTVIYLYKKLLWNPELDVDAALDEHCRVMFGPAAADVAEYYRTVIERWENTRWQDLTEDELRRPHGGLKWTRYYRDAYPREVRMALKSVLARSLTRVEEDTVYHARTDYLVNALAPFFAQGDFLDRGEMVTAESSRFTPVVDGDLGEWGGVRPLSMKNNANGADVSAPTDVYTAYDSEALYIAVHAREPGEIRAHPPAGPGMRDKLPLWRHDSIEVFLCAEQPGMREAMLNTSDQYHQFILDAAGNVFDGYKALSVEKLDATVDVAFRHVARSTADGYVIEMAIPYQALHALPPEPGSSWAANFYRNRPREDLLTEPLHAWSPTLASAHNTSRFGKLTFPAPTLWRSDFTDSGSMELKVWAYRQDAKLSHEVRDGRLVVRVKTGDLGADEYTTVRVDVYPKPQPSFDAPVQFEWRFRVDGDGLQYIVTRASAGGPDASHLRYIGHKARMLQGTGWNLGVADEPRRNKGDQPGGRELTGLAHCTVSIRAGSDADFAFEIDYLRILARQPGERRRE